MHAINCVEKSRLMVDCPVFCTASVEVDGTFSPTSSVSKEFDWRKSGSVEFTAGPLDATIVDVVITNGA